MLAPFWWTLVSINRRNWYASARKSYSNWLLMLLLLVFIFSRDFPFSLPIEALFEVPRLAGFSRSFVDVFLIQHFGLVLVIVPAMAAGTLTDEKTSGTFEYLLTTPLSPLEIILAKWAAQAILAGELALIGLPLFCLFGVFAGLELPAFAGVAASTVLLLLALTAAGVLASVWCRKTTTAVFSTYAIVASATGVIWYAGGANLFLAPFALAGVEPDAPGLTTRLQSAGAWRLVTAICLLLASLRLRPAYRGPPERPKHRRRFCC